MNKIITEGATESATLAETGRGRGNVRSAVRTLSILELFSPQAPRLSIKQISESLALPASTTVRLIQTLESEDYVLKCSDGLYAPGGRLMRIAVAVSRIFDLKELVLPYLQRLRDRTHETVCLAQLASPEEVVYVSQCDSPHAIRHVRWVGERVPVKGTAIGAVLTGACPQGQVIHSRHTLEAGVTAIAAPVFGPKDEIIGGINVTGPSYRISDADVEVISALLRAEVGRIESHL